MQKTKSNFKVTLIGPCKLEKKQKLHDGLYIFVDGGLNHRLRDFKIIKNYISVGDQDSTKSAVDIRLDKSKNFSDLAYALSLIPAKTDQIYFDGFFPAFKYEKRLDHLLFNLGELVHFAKKQKSTLYLNAKMILFSNNKLNCSIDGSFSVVTFEKTRLKITGSARYQIPKPQVVRALSSQTLSNVGSGLIHFESDQPLLIIANEQKLIRK